LICSSRALSAATARRSGPGGELIPTEPKARAKFEQAASIGYARFDPIVSGIIWEKVIERYTGEATNEERVKDVPVVPRLESELDGYEAILSRQRYLSGNVRFSHPGNVPKSCRFDELLVWEVTLSDLLRLTER
jgi:glutathione S-transferase